MKNTLLIIGDLLMSEVKPAPSINKFFEERERLAKKGFDFKFVNYDDVLLRRLPEIDTKKMKIMLFFPFSFWNSKIERYDKDTRIYGDNSFGKYYRDFFLRIKKIIQKTYKDKGINYINSFESCILDRDKVGTSRRLKKCGILTPRIYNINNLDKLYGLLDKKGPMIIKPRFGSMGKGISFITKEECYTNFIFKKDRIISRPYDYNWDFVKLPQNKRDDFLKKIIRSHFVFEELIRLPVVNGRQFDLRIYVIKGNIPYFYARSAPKNNLITNWSQGGRIEDREFLRKVLSHAKIKQIRRIAKRAAKAMKLGFTGIDIILDYTLDNIYVSEAHSFPGYERGFNLMRYLIDRI